MLQSYTCPECNERCLDVSTHTFTSFYCENCEVTYREPKQAPTGHLDTKVEAPNDKMAKGGNVSERDLAVIQALTSALDFIESGYMNSDAISAAQAIREALSLFNVEVPK